MRRPVSALCLLSRVVMTALVLFACASPARREEVNLITVDQELRLGALCAEEVMRTFPLLADPEVARYIEDLGSRLGKRSDWAGLRFTFRVIDSQEVYAFALPGGHVFVTLGMVELAENASQLAGVLAREIAHVVERHGTERVTRRYGLALVSESLVGANPAIGRAIVGELFTRTGILGYGQEAEKGADVLALRYLQRAGYDPRGLLAHVEKLRAREEETPEVLAKWRVTHEPSRVRLRWLRKELKRLPAGEDLVSDEVQFGEMKERLRPYVKP